MLCILCYFLFSTENKQPTVKTQALHYLVELLSGHIGPQEALNGDSCRALLLEASPGNPHANILLNDEGGSGSSQKVDVADRQDTTRYIRKPHTVTYGIPSLLLPALTFVPDDPGRISVWWWHSASSSDTSCGPASSGWSSGCGHKPSAACPNAAFPCRPPDQPWRRSCSFQTDTCPGPVSKPGKFTRSGKASLD